MIEKGKFIVLEGIDGAGKTTLQEALIGKLAYRGISVIPTREPDRTFLLAEKHANPISQWAKCYMYAADRAETMRTLVYPAVNQRDWVVADRCIYSSIAYQGFGHGLGPARVKDAHAHSMVVHPDLVIYLKVPVRVGQDRATGPIDSRDFLERVAFGYDKMAEGDPRLWKVIDATQSQNEVIRRAWAFIQGQWPNNYRLFQ